MGYNPLSCPSLSLSLYFPLATSSPAPTFLLARDFHQNKILYL